MYSYCVVVILFNPEDEVLNRILNYLDIFPKVFIIDNSVVVNEYIVKKLSEYKSIDYYGLEGNKGISYALNFAFHKGIEQGFNFMLTMDQDSIFRAKDIDFMINFIEKNDKDDIGIYAPNFSRLFYDTDNQKSLSSEPTYPVNEILKVNFAITSGSFIKLNAVKKTLPLDENYFIAYVDFDLGMQMKSAGYYIVIVGKAMLYQKIGGVIKKSSLAEKFRFTNYATNRYYYLVRNNFYIRNKYNDDSQIRLMTYKKLAKYIFKIFTSEKNKLDKVRMGYHGYCDYRKRRMGKKENID